MAGVGNLGELSPYAARDAAGFIASMNELKQRSGMTFRELEEQAARNGDVLARSTLADVLRRPNLPRPDVLAVFVRACGDGRRVGDWLDARERITEAGPEPLPPAPATAPAPAVADVRAEAGDVKPTPLRQQPRRLILFALAFVLAAGLLAGGLWAFLPDESGDPSTPTDGWVTISPARDGDLCLTDGRDRAGAYDSAVAVQLPCAQAPVPRTYLEPAGEGLYRVQWHHPQQGKGCLTVMRAGPVKGMIEPRDDCTGATRFRLEPAPDDAAGFRLRPAHSGQCVGTAARIPAEGAEAVQEPCADTPDQYFVIRTD
ncbi:XRE family transcriptional regulator [Streptomyces fructofermentans]|uniref:RICIN domain-containing protein n=1 Tax=Streptomyces fructofermentans TaxID=152141 RepID=UPI0033C68040